MENLLIALQYASVKVMARMKSEDNGILYRKYASVTIISSGNSGGCCECETGAPEALNHCFHERMERQLNNYSVHMHTLTNPVTSCFMWCS